MNNKITPQNTEIRYLSQTQKKVILKPLPFAIAMVLLIPLIFSNPLYGQTNAVYDFNTAGQFENNVFNASGPNLANVVESVSGGINNTGSITVPSVSTNAIFATKDGYSQVGPCW